MNICIRFDLLGYTCLLLYIVPDDLITVNVVFSFVLLLRKQNKKDKKVGRVVIIF